ncbi:phenylacetate--CoA ligase family protein [Desulforudis sp. 1088]|uniref:phenylacetate--CoA ligase family protein n=1 Tax=unclassified Candidatus Desulforudis TaxID=2635950 RepID=UPI003CE475F0
MRRFEEVHYWNQESECMPVEERRKLQLARLQELVRRVYETVPFYQRSIRAQGLRPGEIKSLDDLTKLPFTTKADLRNTYPFGLFAVLLKDIVRVHASSGTTGKPTVVGYTRRDIETWSEVCARSLVCAGLRRDDVLQVAYGYGLFTGGLGVHYGAEKLGATVIPMSVGNTKRQVMLMDDFGVTAVACTPSYALHLAEVIEELGVDRARLRLRAGIFGAEPWSEGLRKEIEQKLNISAMDIYGLSEIMGPGVAMECPYKDGLHIFDDHFLPEVIDPETGEPLPYGEKGELVITTLTKEGFPLIRYRTRDITVLHDEPCPCGRTHVRMSRIMGRTDDMLIIRGVNVFPSQVESALLDIGQAEPHYLLVVDRRGPLDYLEIWVEVSEKFFADEVRRLEELETKFKAAIESVLGISVKVKLVEPKTIERSQGKAKRVVDRRDVYKD